MNENEFLHRLQYEPVTLDNWHVDFSLRPPPYKIYHGNYYELSDILPKAASTNSRPMDPMQYLSIILKYSYGLNSVNWQQGQSNCLYAEDEYRRFYRRAIPSAGAIYANEVYLYIKGVNRVETGVYHYNVPQNRLNLIISGNYDDILLEAINTMPPKEQSITLLVTVVFWRNMFTQGYFSYRLQPQNTGILLAQAHSIIKELCLECNIYYEYDATLLASLLNIDPMTESIYGVVDIDINEFNWSSNCDLVRVDEGDNKNDFMDVPITEYDHYGKMVALANHQVLVPMQYSSGQLNFSSDPIKYSLPPGEFNAYDIIKISRQRVSPGKDFKLKPISLQTISNILSSSFQLFSDVQTDLPLLEEHFYYFISIKENDKLNNGCYYYDAKNHQLTLRREGNIFSMLDELMTQRNLNIQNVCFCIHVAINKSFLFESTKHYKTLLTHAGMLYQFIQFFVTHEGLGSHFLMRFDAKAVESLYQIDDLNLAIVAQIPIGRYSRIPRLVGMLP